MQYGRRLVYGGAGEQVTTLRVPAAAFTNATLDALISEVGSGSLSFKLDVGNDGTWDWQWSGNVSNATTLNSPGLAAAFSAYWAGHGAPTSGSLDVPVKVSLSKGGQVLLTNLQMTPGGSTVRAVRLPARPYSTLTLDLTVGESGSSPLTLAADVGDDGTVDWTWSGTPAYPLRLTTANLATAVNAYLTDRSGEVDVPIRFHLAPFLSLALTAFNATPSDQPDVALSAATINFGLAGATAEQPNLQPSTFQPSTFQPSTEGPTEGDTLTVTATLTNTGALDSGALTAAFFATAPGWGETYAGSAFVPTVPAGGTAQAGIPWNTLGFTGTVPIRVVADLYNRLAESDENNNEATANLTIRTRPDLQIESINLTLPSPCQGYPLPISPLSS